MIDYRELLKKYMEMVAEAEGITFIDFGSKHISVEEQRELELIEKEIFSESLEDANP